jgi:hypothetical protein
MFNTANSRRKKSGNSCRERFVLDCLMFVLGPDQETFNLVKISSSRKEKAWQIINLPGFFTNL